MKRYENKLKLYIEENSIDCEYLKFDKSCHTVKEAADAVGKEIGDLVKNVCLKDESGNLIVCIVNGMSRVSTKKVAKVLGIERPTMATPDFIYEKIEYPVGGVSSFGFDKNTLTIIDSKVLKMGELYTSGGSERTLIKISVDELLRITDAKQARIRR